jgi:trehalose utilization protein
MFAMATPLKVLVWDEYPAHAPKEIYPDGIRGAVAEGLKRLDVAGEFEVTAIGLDEPDQGLPSELLASADVLLWWGHARHGEVKDELAEEIAKHVKTRGLGLVVLHSGHYSKPFQKTLNTTGHLKGGWREAEPADTEEITVCAPRHPIAAGISDFTLDKEEMYGAPFDVPPAECLVFQSYFPLGGEYFPCGITWTVGEGIDPEFTSGPGGGKGQGDGKGRVFYFRPGHEAFDTYYKEPIQQVIYNGVRWAARLV